MISTEGRPIFDDDLQMFRDQVRKFFDRSLVPNLDRWERDKAVDRDFWLECGRAGLLCPTVSPEYGGLGLDFRYNAVVGEELGYHNAHTGITLQSDVIADYIEQLGTKEQKRHWLPKMISGEAIAAIAMTEPGTGSDLQAVRTSATRSGDDYVINGSKTYISNGQTADFVVLIVKTDPDAGAKGLSLILVEAGTPGFERGRKLDKIGQNPADTSELFFDDCRVPQTNLLGDEGKGFGYLMNNLPQERLTIAIFAQASAQRAFDEAVNFTRERQAFGRRVFDFQNTRFTLAALQAKLQPGWAHLDWCLERHVRGALTSAEASIAKLFHTELLGEACDVSLQLHGGAGYMNEYVIARLWRDARAQRIYGGTSEIMKELIARAI
jgi:alkylation response protein AidB-like acyl-CoA dehydrogenase